MHKANTWKELYLFAFSELWHFRCLLTAKTSVWVIVWRGYLPTWHSCSSRAIVRLSNSQKHSMELLHAAKASYCVLPWRKLHFATVRKAPFPVLCTEIQLSWQEQQRHHHLSTELGSSAHSPVQAASNCTESDQNIWSHWVKRTRCTAGDVS